MRKYIVVVFVLALLSCRNSGQGNAKQSKDQVNISRAAIEFIVKDETIEDDLKNYLDKTQIDCFRWKNHFVLFGESVDEIKVPEEILLVNNAIEIKRYNVPLYMYDKATHCADNKVTKPWKNYLLTANLLEDKVLQQEYVEYHDSQFEVWPEVAEGFCHANFQQLMVYRNGRQLLLVISIPANKTLDELNPLTVENNPRMVEWNNIMGKYQEGIEGTAPEETWVFLEKIVLE